MFNPSYGFTRTLPQTSLDQARERITTALKDQGFGVLTEIDVKATLKEKIDVDFQPYVILGACNPNLAHQALTKEPAIGLLLPCNVVVTETDNGDAVVSIAKPAAMFDLVRNTEMDGLVEEATTKLSTALELA